jgi:hypothetical protein
MEGIIYFGRTKKEQTKRLLKQQRNGTEQITIFDNRFV